MFVALALTPATERIIGAAQLAAMRPDAWLANVARGRHVDTDALVAALRSRLIGGAALDVTDPEPLPDGHPLSDLDNAIITPHTADTPEMIQRMLARRIGRNVAAFAAGEPLEGLVDPVAGYEAACPVNGPWPPGRRPEGHVIAGPAWRQILTRNTCPVSSPT